jgi:hypothetical protein
MFTVKVNDNVLHKKVLIERLTKMSYLIEEQQKIYKNIDVKREIVSLSGCEPMIGYYFDLEFLNSL